MMATEMYVETKQFQHKHIPREHKFCILANFIVAVKYSCSRDCDFTDINCTFYISLRSVTCYVSLRNVTCYLRLLCILKALSLKRAQGICK